MAKRIRRSYYMIGFIGIISLMLFLTFILPDIIHTRIGERQEEIFLNEDITTGRLPASHIQKAPAYILDAITDHVFSSGVFIVLILLLTVGNSSFTRLPTKKKDKLLKNTMKATILVALICLAYIPLRFSGDVVDIRGQIRGLDDEYEIQRYKNEVSSPDNLVNMERRLKEDIYYTSMIDEKKDSDVFVLGDSTFLYPQKGERLIERLKVEFGNTTIADFSTSRLDSGNMRVLVKKLLQDNESLPDTIVIYPGHDEYIRAYDIINKDYKIFNQISTYISMFSGHSLDYSRRLTHARIIEALQAMGLLDIEHKDFEVYDEILLDIQENNMRDIIETARDKNVTVTLVTPISNLQTRPYGNLETTELYHKGREEDNYDTSIELLKEAKDQERFRRVRSKSMTDNMLRNISEEYDNAYLLDLDNVLIGDMFPFNHDSFTNDRFFNADTNRLVAEDMKELIMQEGLIDDGKE